MRALTQRLMDELTNLLAEDRWDGLAPAEIIGALEMVKFYGMADGRDSLKDTDKEDDE